MAKELEEAAVAAELARWTPVVLDLDVQAGDVEELGVVTAPALRIFTPTGQYVAGCDRYLSPDEIVAWLKEHYDAALAPADDVLLARASRAYRGRQAGQAVRAAQCRACARRRSAA